MTPLYLILSGISLLLFLLILPTLTDILPALTGCLVRSNEVVNLENSVSTARSRNLTALALTLPFCLMVARTELFPAAFLQRLSADLRLLAVMGLLAGLALLKSLGCTLSGALSPSSRDREAALHASYSFFIILAVVTLLSSWTLSLLHAGLPLQRSFLRGEILVILLLYLLRKVQILPRSCSILQSISYLCAADLLPVGILVATALLF